jgi:PucR family transcriptional regulator, purine catabolism regulatory protein
VLPVSSGEDSPITVREVLALPVMRRGVPEVVAGEKGLDRPVRWVHSGEVPYIAAMLRGRELLLMTGIGIGHGESVQRDFVADLAERDVAGLAIELGARFRRIPRALRAEAGERGLPLVALHKEIRFVDVTEAVHREIVGRQLELMRHGDELNRRFTSLMLEGAGIPEVLKELTEEIGNPVILEKRDRGVLYHATHQMDDVAVLAGWDAFAARLPGAPQAVEQPVPAGGGGQWGRLVALGIDGPLDRRARVALERAVGLIALALHRHHAEQVVASRARGDFLASLLEGEVHGAEARQRAADMGLTREAGPLLPIAVGPSGVPPTRPPGRNERSWSLVWRDLQRELEDRHMPAIAGTRAGERELLLVVVLRDAGARAGTADQLASLLVGAAERHLGTPDGVVVSVGSVAASWASVGESLRVAVEGLAAAAHARPRPWHDATLPDLDGLLWSLRDRPELRRFAESRLEPLLEHDRRRRAKLLPTLEALCRHGGRKAETARELHIERQSLYHRLSRIEELLGVDLSDGEALLDLHLALRARSRAAS